MRFIRGHAPLHKVHAIILIYNNIVLRSMKHIRPVSGGGPGALTSIVVVIVPKKKLNHLLESTWRTAERQFSLYKIWDDLHMVPYFCDE